MNRALFSFVVLLAILTLPATASAQAPTGTPKLRVAVMDLSGTALSMQTTYAPTMTTTTVAIPPPTEFARGLTEMMTTALVETGRFVVLDRKALQQVLAEQDLGPAGRLNPETAPAVGQAIGAQVLITGDITEFTYDKTSLAGNLSILQSLGASGERINAMVALDIRLIDAVTGEVVFSKRAEGDASSTGIQADVNVSNQQFGTGVGTSTPLGKASREAIEDAVEAIVQGLEGVPWNGRVVDVRGTSVYVNAGSESGMRLGTDLDVFAQEAALVDPETGVSLGAPDRKIGRIRVAQVEEKYSVAQVVDGSDFGRGHLVRVAGSRARP